MIECEWCDNKQQELNKFVYHTNAFSEKIVVNICNKCIDKINTIHQCESCYRYICHSRGYRINIRYGYKFDKQEYDIICVKCLQDLWFKYGMELFEHADFFEYKDLSDNGFNKIHSFFCRSEQSYNEARQIFDKLKEQNLVIINIDSSGHIEHHISLYIKPIKVDKP